ncbi:hypothetical protein D922_00922 [Enterococcus faecalis 06-MB-DW-09]|nr:hypothetical protein D922_00922 [Enterococcus faecalis 06-MB-DW-09]
MLFFCNHLLENNNEIIQNFFFISRLHKIKIKKIEIIHLYK